MNLHTFFVKYENGLRQIYHALHDSAESFINEHFGSAWKGAKERGAHITMTDHDPDARLNDPKYDHHFDDDRKGPPAPPSPAPPPPPPAPPSPAPEPPPPPAPAPEPPPPPAPEPAPAPAPAPVSEPPAPAPADPPVAPPPAPTGDVTLAIGGVQSDSTAGVTQH